MTIIFLNGVGSAGKSTLAKAIQVLSPTPYINLSFDAFFNMMPTQYVGNGVKAQEGFHFITREENGKPVVTCQTGQVGRKVCDAIPHMAKIMANQGLDLVIDEILFGDEQLKQYIDALKDNTVYFVGVICALEVLEEREILRGDRVIGLALDQVNRVHKGFRPYDVTVDTTNKNPFDCARQILDFIKYNPQPKGFRKEFF